MKLEKGKSPVYLKTGGPAMVAKGEIVSGIWACTWFDGNKLMEAEFDESLLTDESPYRISWGSNPKRNHHY